MGTPVIPIVEYDDLPIQTLHAIESLPAHHVGHGAVERLFCRTAHQHVRGTLHYTIHPAERCPSLRRFYKCERTGSTCQCLFAEPDSHPHWQRIRQSIALEARHVRETSDA
jgi:hypothetical protein